MTDRYTYWRAELKAPNSLSRDTTDPIDGFWRINAAKTKADYPVAIWNHDGLMFRVGSKVLNEAEIADFMEMTFPNCSAITRDEWQDAVKTGFWSDGKPARNMAKAEAMGIDTEAGDNAAPVEESLADQIEAQAEIAKNMKEPTNQAEADKASGVVEKLRELWKLADAERIKEKAPLDEQAKAVQAKWKPMLDMAKGAGGDLDKRRKAYLLKEQRKLDEAAAEARRKAEAEAKAKAEAEGIPADQVQPEPVEAKRATSGTAHGRQTGLRQVKVGYITDKAKFIEALKDDSQLAEFLEKRCQSFARSDITMPGMEIRSEYQ